MSMPQRRIELEKVKMEARGETIRELDSKYNTMCTLKINAAVEALEKRIKELEEINELNAASIRRGREQNLLLRAIVEAADYCYRHEHIDQAAVIFTELDKHFEAWRKRHE